MESDYIKCTITTSHYNKEIIKEISKLFAPVNVKIIHNNGITIIKFLISTIEKMSKITPTTFKEYGEVVWTTITHN